ncbi:hypothetical protein [Colwellia echini]|uniref:Lipopolysaccharide export system protein LptC n=1 Tax=Colwellia echini TaxID=1982103 RepID=A0ABY3MT78_9GAMM|nr:hypothetical protein [Colwellia echini]TYK64394.1 hypothetical protein CWS31_015885 [Colwellia echini]
MNRLAVLAFALLLFFSTMSWYLANGSLNDYLKSQVILQSEYYTSEPAQLVSAHFSETSGITQFESFSLKNIEGLQQSLILTIDSINAQLAEIPIEQLDSPSIQKKTTTLVHIKELRLAQVNAWSENLPSVENSPRNKKSQTNLDLFIERISIVLAKDYPALYPQLGAKIYAQQHPERNEELALAGLEHKPTEAIIETNKAIIASNAAKQQKRLLGKATTRVKISSVIIEQLTLTTIKNNETISLPFKNISLGNIGDENGLASNQLGGELLKQLFTQLSALDKANR